MNFQDHSASYHGNILIIANAQGPRNNFSREKYVKSLKLFFNWNSALKSRNLQKHVFWNLMNYWGEAVKVGKNADVMGKGSTKAEKFSLALRLLQSSVGKYFVFYKEDWLSTRLGKVLDQWWKMPCLKDIPLLT